MALNREALPQAALIALALLALFLVITFAKPLSILPGYPAVILAFLIWCILPGWFLQRALFADRQTGFVEQAAMAFAMSVALAAVPGLVALRLHLSLEAFAVLYALVAVAATAASLLWQGPGRDDFGPVEDEPAEAKSSVKLLVVLIAIPLLAIATSPWWEDGRIARDADDLVYMAFVNEYQVSGIDAAAPLMDTGRGAFGRMQFNVWMIMQALLAETADVKAIDLLLINLPPLITLLVLASMFTLARGLFPSSTIALLAVVFVLLYGMLDLAPHEGYGRNIFLRVAEDKMVSSYVLLPLGLLMLVRLTASPQPGRYVAMLLAIAALFVVHPMALMFLGLATISLIALRALTERSFRAIRSTGWLIGAWAFVWLGLYLSATQGSGQGSFFDEPFRRGFHIVDLAGSFVIASHHLIIHPLMLFAIILAVPAWLVARQSLPNQLLLACVGTVVVVTYTPLLATPLAHVVNEEAVWRLHWLVPVPLILAYALHSLLSNLPQRGQAVASGPWALAAAVVLVGGAGFLLQEHYLSIDGHAYYDRASDSGILPWTDGSIARGGVDRALSSDWRPTATEAALLQFLDERTTPGSAVLLPDSLSDRFFAGARRGVRSISIAGTPGNEFLHALVRAYYSGTLAESVPDREVEDILDDLAVDYVVVPPRTELDDEARTFAEFDASAFSIELGDPELITIEEASGSLLDGWALDYLSEQRIGGASFTVPPDLNPSAPTLEFLIETVSLSSDAEGVATIVVTYFEEGVAGTTSVVTEIAVPEDVRRGERFITRRPVGVPVEAGTTYSFIVSTLPDTATGQINQDIVLTGVSIKYWPERFTPIGSGGYFIYER